MIHSLFGFAQRVVSILLANILIQAATATKSGLKGHTCHDYLEWT